jgi:hypothetical protein
MSQKLTFNDFSNEEIYRKIRISVSEPGSSSVELSASEKYVIRKMVEERLGLEEPATDNEVAGMVIKQKLIESQCDNGYCYLRLIAMLPVFRKCRASAIENAIRTMRIALGAFPEGISVLTQLNLVNIAIKENFMDLGLGDRKLVDTVGFLRELKESPVCFEWTEKGGYYHVGKVQYEPCRCNEVVCSHGFSSRFLMCVMVQPGLKIGGTIDLGALFADVENDNEPAPETLQPLPSRGNAIPIWHDQSYYEQQDTDDKSNTIERLNKQIQEMMAKESQKESETVLPDDSSSQVSRYEKKFMKDGTVFSRRGRTQDEMLYQRPRESVDDRQTVYNVSKKSGTVIGFQQEVSRPIVVKDVVRGFVKTEGMAQKEAESNKKIAPINGLANPFKSHRLNLLCHFHTAVDSVLTGTGEMTYYDALSDLAQLKAVTPSQELSHQIVVRTFDMKSSVVMANPFKLPFVEIGMIMSDDCLNKCFKMLNMEYQILWFEEMKSLKVPSFHRVYDSHRETKLTSSSSRTDYKVSKERNPEGFRRKRTDRSGSMFSLRA